MRRKLVLGMCVMVMLFSITGCDLGDGNPAISSDAPLPFSAFLGDWTVACVVEDGYCLESVRLADVSFDVDAETATIVTTIEGCDITIVVPLILPEPPEPDPEPIGTAVSSSGPEEEDNYVEAQIGGEGPELGPIEICDLEGLFCVDFGAEFSISLDTGKIEGYYGLEVFPCDESGEQIEEALISEEGHLTGVRDGLPNTAPELNVNLVNGTWNGNFSGESHSNYDCDSDRLRYKDIVLDFNEFGELELHTELQEPIKLDYVFQLNDYGTGGYGEFTGSFEDSHISDGHATGIVCGTFEWSDSCKWYSGPRVTGEVTVMQEAYSNLTDIEQDVVIDYDFSSKRERPWVADAFSLVGDWKLKDVCLEKVEDEDEGAETNTSSSSYCPSVGIWVTSATEFKMDLSEFGELVGAELCDYAEGTYGLVEIGDNKYSFQATLSDEDDCEEPDPDNTFVLIIEGTLEFNAFHDIVFGDLTADISGLDDGEPFEQSFVGTIGVSYRTRSLCIED